MALTPRQKKFADEWIKTGNAYQSALTAGYSESYAKVKSSKSLESGRIKAYIEERTAKADKKRIMDADEALELLTRIARGEETETVVVGTPQGAETVEKTPDNRQKMAAVKELLKRYPNSDRLLEAQTRKLEAEAKLAERQLAAETEDIKIEFVGFGNGQDD